MKYVVPLNAADEVNALVDAGADELYCGFQDAWWVERYGDHDSASRRQGAANISTIEELQRAALLAHERGVPLYLACNARYTEPQLDYLVEVCETFEAAGGVGAIVSDLGLLWRLKGRTGLKRCLSLLAVPQNVATLKAFHELGVTRVVFPRFMGYDEAGQLLGAVPGLEGEFMAFFDKCPWVDGYCRHRHGVAYLPRFVDKNQDDAPPLFTFDTTYESHACMRGDCMYKDPYPCAACYVSRFEAAGIEYAKLGGRGRLLDERLCALRFLREAEKREDDTQRIDLYHNTFGRECACYYGESAQRRSAIEPVESLGVSCERNYLGSETDIDVFRDDVTALCQSGPSDDGAALTVLVPPLSESMLDALLSILDSLDDVCAPGTHMCVNDLGTLIALSQARRACGYQFELTMGTLLARLDDPNEVAHFLAPDENPPRGVWGPDAQPRMLTYAPPPAPLQQHWRTPSATEPSTQAALRELTGGIDVPFEFA